jgi:hypothetical protein
MKELQDKLKMIDKEKEIMKRQHQESLERND